MDNDLLTAIAALISSATALVAVFIGPAITARLQHRQTISAMREKWIQDLRETISELISTAETAASVIVQARAVAPQLKESYDRLVRLEGKAKMMLNPKESHHRELQAGLEKIVTLADDQSIQAVDKMPKMRELTESLIPVTQAVLKEAWDKIK